MPSTIPRIVKEIGHAALHVAYSRLFSERTFVLHGSRYRYFYHRYNNTCETERCVEIPVAWAFLETCGARNVLEIGNVLNHYAPFPHTVVDKYEIADGVQNVDVSDFSPAQKYDAIISISTLEHVGWDEMPFDSQTAVRSIERLRGMLIPDAKMLISFPIGHNTGLDQGIVENSLGCEKLFGMKRTGRSRWVEIRVGDLIKNRLEPPYRCNHTTYRQTKAIAFAIFGSRP